MRSRPGDLLFREDRSYASTMTYAHMGSLEVRAGHLDEVVAILTRSNPDMAEAGCLSYEVGADPERPDTVCVAELWESAEAHRESLQLPSVRAAIAEAMPLLTGQMDGRGFDVTGSPLRPD